MTRVQMSPKTYLTASDKHSNRRLGSPDYGVIDCQMQMQNCLDVLVVTVTVTITKCCCADGRPISSSFDRL